MRFTFKALGKTKERAKKNCPIKAFLADSIKKPHTPQDGQSILCV